MDSIKKLLILFTFLFFCSQSIANVIKQVRVQGNKKVSQQAILNQIQTRSGKKLRSSTVTKDIKKLYQMNYFSHISASSHKNSKEQLIVTFKVKEKPQIRSIIYKGQSNTTKDKLTEISELKEYEFLDIKKLKTAIKNIKNHYREKGYFLSEATYSLKEVSQKVDITISIEEGEKALIQRISFIGNKNISSDRLKSFLSHKEKNIFSFISDSGTYKKENLSRDIQVIKLIYMENGYMEAQVEEPQVAFSPAKDGIYISFSIREGEQFKVGNIDFSGDLIFSKLDLKNRLSLKKGDIFVYSNFQKDVLSLQHKYGDEGYAFSNVIPRFASIDGEIHILFQIEKGDKVSVNQINIVGNNKTRDKVIRREVKVSEGGLYNSSLIEASKLHIQRLGYFDDVTMLSQPIKDDKVDIQVTVKERENYGEFSGGMSYRQQDEKFLSWGNLGVNTSLHQQNVFGLGQTVRATANVNLNTVWVNAQYIDPHLFDTDWYFSFDLFYENSWINQYFKSDDFQSDVSENQPYPLFSGRPYIIERRGFRLGLGYWFEDQWKILPSVGLLNMKMRELSEAVVMGIAPSVRKNFNLDESEGFRAVAGLTIEYNGKNDALFPTGGMHANLATDYTHKFAVKDKFSAVNLFKVDGSFSHYINLKKFLSDVVRLNLNSFMWSGYLSHVTLKNKIQVGYIHSLGADPFIPVDLLYLLGGPTDLRGYPLFSIGTPLSSTQDNGPTTTYGGAKQFVYNLELQIPISLSNRLYGVLFFDLGHAEDSIFRNIFKNGWSALKKDVGLGVSWASPMGPVHLRLGFPVGDSQNSFFADRKFHFNMGYDF